MQRTLTIIYFSATDTTALCVGKVAEAIGLPIGRKINLAEPCNRKDPYPALTENEVALVAAPVYGGRLPHIFADCLKRFHASHTPAVAMVVYGNRDYDDSLLELADILELCGCAILAVGAFIGQHSIFPRVATGRPDKADLTALAQFGQQCRKRLENDDAPVKLEIKGKRPYKNYGGVPFHPECDPAGCTRCGVCAAQCPTGAINPRNPTATDIGMCISCGRCIHVCSKKARAYSGAKYAIIARLFRAMFSKRREPMWIIS